MRRKLRCLNACRFGLLCALLCAFELAAFAIDGLAGEKHVLDVPSVDMATTTLPKKWRQKTSSARIEILDMLANQARGNYEKIRTWKGTYVVHMKQYLSSKAVKDGFRREIPEDKASALWQEFDFTMSFAIDILSGSIYRSKQTKTMRFLREDSNETVTVPNTRPMDGCSIVTAEHYLQFDPKVVWPGFTTVPGQPEARNKRVAFREPPAVGKGNHGDLMNPMDFFGFSDNQKFADELDVLSDAMKGRRGIETNRKSNQSVFIYEASEPGDTWYRLDETFAGPNSGKPSNLYMTVIFSHTAGFNAVSLLMTKDKAGQQPERTMSWQWKMVNGVYVPETVKESIYSKDGGKLVYQRELHLQECSVNGQLEPSQFSYKSFGMKDGELVMDNIDKACYIIKNGTPEKLANFDEKYIPAGPGIGASLPRWKVMVCGGLLVLLLGIFGVRRYRKSAA